MKIRNLILLTFGLLPFFAVSQTATFDRVRVRQGLTIRAEKADSIIRAVTALSNHTSIPTAKAVWDAIAAIVAASKYQTLRDDGSNMTQQPAANFVSSGTVSFALTNDAGNSETEVSAAVPTGGITTTEILDGTIANADIATAANIANSKLANSGVTAGTYPSTGGVIPLLTINSKGIITAVSESTNVDASATNEGRLGVGAGGSNNALLTSNTSGATGVTYEGGTAIGISETTNTNGGSITITNTGDTDGSNDLTLSDTTRRVLNTSTHFKYPTAAAVYAAISAGGGGPDSTFALAPGGGYAGKRITDNVYRTGKVSIGTTDTAAMLNLKPKNPVGSGHTIASYLIPPNRTAFSNAAFANFSILEASRIDLNPMRPAHYLGFLYGRWTDTYTIDSTTNLWAGRPGNSIRNTGFNLENENPALAKWKWSTEQHYLPPGSTAAAWEDHLECVDTLARIVRPFQLFGQHNGNSYSVGFAANDFHIDKPHNSGYLLRIRGDGSNTGKWSTDYPYTFQISNATRIGPLMERLHNGAYRNVLDWTANGRLDVGDSSGVQVTNRLQIIRANATQPEIISPEGYVVFDSTRLEVNSTDGNNRHIIIKRPGTSHTWGLNYSATAFAFEADYARTPFSIARTAVSGAFTINATGKVGLGIPDAYSLIHAQQPANDLSGGLILAPTTGNYFGLYVNGSNEVAFNRGGTNRMYLTEPGQLKLPSYTSASSFSITPTGVLGFNSSGEIGTIADTRLLPSGTTNQTLRHNGTVWESTSFLSNTGSSLNAGNIMLDGNNIFLPITGLVQAARFRANATGSHTLLESQRSGVRDWQIDNVGGDIWIYSDGTGGYHTKVSSATGYWGLGGSATERLHIFGNSISEGRQTIRSTGTNAALYLSNTTASTGKEWYLNSVNAGDLVIGNPTAADAITINGTTGATTIGGPLTLNTAAGTATTLTGRTSSGVFTDVGIGSGLSLSGGTLSVTGGAGNYQTFRDDGTDRTQRAAANFVSSATVAAVLTDDPTNGETEIALNIPDGAIQDEQLAATGVTAGSYTNADITVDADGRVTAVANGSAPTGTVLQNGNSFAAGMVIGTNDANTLSLETNNVVRAVYTGGASTGGALTHTDVSANTNTVESIVTRVVNSSGTAAAGFGQRQLLQLESSTTNAQDAASMDVLWTTATHASRTADVVFSNVNNATSLSETFRIAGNGNLTSTSLITNTNTAADVLTIRANSTGTPANNFGGSILFQGESSTTNNQNLVRLSSYWGTATDASRASNLGIQLVTAGSATPVEGFTFTNANNGTLSIGTLGGTRCAYRADGFTSDGACYLVSGGGSSIFVGGGISEPRLKSTIEIELTPEHATSTANYIVVGKSATATNTSGDKRTMEFQQAYVASSGTGTLTSLKFANTVNQTSTASGVIRAIQIAPTLTSVTGTYRAVDIAANHANAKGIYQSGTSTTNNFAGNTAFGSTSAPAQSADFYGNVRLRALRMEDYATLTGTGTVTASTTISDNLYKPGSTQATLTLNLPGSPTDMQICSVGFGNIVTTLTVSGNGNTLNGTAPTTAAVGDSFAYKFYSGTGWIKIK